MKLIKKNCLLGILYRPLFCRKTKYRRRYSDRLLEIMNGSFIGVSYARTVCENSNYFIFGFSVLKQI